MASVGHYKGHLTEVLLEAYQNATARLTCPPEAAPKPGQYLLAFDPSNEMEVVPTALFAAGEVEPAAAGSTSLPILAALPAGWQPGVELSLRGPLGRGFELPRRAQRVALAGLADNPGRLLPLVGLALRQGADVVMCCQRQPKGLPLAVEVRGLDSLPEALRWADYVAVDVPIEGIEILSGHLSRIPRVVLGQALVFTPMPCGGLAQCGVCTLAKRSGGWLLCEDGPVMELNQLAN